MLEGSKHKGFKRLSFITLIAVYFLILVGGVVRSTGSGMGCPDWPMCFGSLVPPTDVSELPENYKEYYANYRHEKNIRLAGFLNFLGMPEKANQVINDKSILVEEDFNVYKTWTEYANRLVGATIGILIFATMIGSIAYFKKDRTVFYLSVAAFLLVGFEGWIGAFVVSTNLMPWIISIHMILALIIVLLLIYINFRIRRASLNSSFYSNKNVLVTLTILCLVTMGIQIILGTQVREAIDKVAADHSFALRETWISKAGASFLIHRSFSLLILGLFGWLLYSILKKKQQSTFIKNVGKYIAALIAIEIMSGMIMAYLGIPPFIQPIHLLFSTIIFGVLYYMYLIIINSNNKIATS
jgi:cytochrome c oxidase assembly protein subunit 15